MPVNNIEAAWFGTQNLEGSLASQDILAEFIQKAQNEEQVYALANDDFLNSSMQEQKDRLAALEENIRQLESAISEKKTDFAITAVAGAVSAILGGTLLVATSPVWVGVATGTLILTGTISLAVSLARNADDLSQSGMTLVGYANNRVGLVGTPGFASSTGKIIGKACFVAGILIDLSSLYITNEEWDKAEELRGKAADEYEELKTMMFSGPLSDTESWRTYKIEEAQHTQKALENIRALYLPDTPDYKSSTEIPINPQF